MIAPPKPPAQDELELLIKEARERQLRRRLLGAAGVVIGTAVTLSVFAVAVGGGGHARRTGSSASAGAPLCRASQLSSTAGLNGAVGTLDGTVLLTNAGGSACSFPTGRPRVTVLWRGHVLPTREARLPEARMRRLPVLAPHTAAAIDMDWANWCGKPSHKTLIDPTFRLAWAGRLQVDVPNGISLPPPRCDGGRSTSLISVGRPYRNALLAR